MRAAKRIGMAGAARRGRRNILRVVMLIVFLSAVCVYFIPLFPVGWVVPSPSYDGSSEFASTATDAADAATVGPPTSDNSEDGVSGREQPDPTLACIWASTAVRVACMARRDK